jgi:hypothetical protein
MGDILRFNNNLSSVLSEISDNSYCSVFLGISNDGEAHSEE